MSDPERIDATTDVFDSELLAGQYGEWPPIDLAEYENSVVKHVNWKLQSSNGQVIDLRGKPLINHGGLKAEHDGSEPLKPGESEPETARKPIRIVAGIGVAVVVGSFALYEVIRAVNKARPKKTQ
jgi:hypothetical protein